MLRFLAALVAVFSCLPVRADWITEFGAGYKLDSSSIILLPECDKVPITPENPVYWTHQHFGRAETSCGGDNPIFFGWPIAWEAEINDGDGPWRYRVGWFHFSSIGDGHGVIAKAIGGDGREAHMDCLCATATFNWSKRKKP